MLVACITVTSGGSRNKISRAVESLAWQHRCGKPKQETPSKKIDIGRAGGNDPSFEFLIQESGAV
jgi:hypothetical protein